VKNLRDSIYAKYLKIGQDHPQMLAEGVTAERFAALMVIDLLNSLAEIDEAEKALNESERAGIRFVDTAAYRDLMIGGNGLERSL
jgi:hypothetical protein